MVIKLKGVLHQCYWFRDSRTKRQPSKVTRTEPNLGKFSLLYVNLTFTIVYLHNKKQHYIRVDHKRLNIPVLILIGLRSLLPI